jgi:hypothetical protein
MTGLIRDRFLWVEKLRKGLVFLLEESIHPHFNVTQASDPLTAYLTITLVNRFPKASRAAIRTYIRAFAALADCEVPKIDIEDQKIVATILFKYRHPQGKTREEHDQT